MSPGHNKKTTMLPSSLLILVTTMILLLCDQEGGTTRTNGFFRLVRAEEKEPKNNTEAAAPSSDVMMTENDNASSSAVTIDNVYSYVIIDDAEAEADNMTTTEDIESALEDGFGTSVPDANITGINLLYNYSVSIDEEATDIDANETTSLNEIEANETSSNETVVDCPGFDYDCYSCIRNGCHWCAYDSLCFNTPEFVSKISEKQQTLFSGKAHSCKLEKDFTQTQCTVQNAHFDDPMYGGLNWIFEKIKVKPVWERGIYGNGIHVRINDEGIELSHPEFIGRVDLNSSCEESPRFPLSTPILDSRTGLPSNHGNVVTALVGASGNNSHCSVGIAPKVTFSLCPGGPDDLFSKLDQVDISQNSWAVEGCGWLSVLDINRARYLQDVHANDDDNSTSISMISDGLNTLPENPACQFVHNPDFWNGSPCDKCTVFQDATNTTNLHVLMQDMGDDCVSAIVTHCNYFYREDRRACEIYKDLILMKKYPRTKGECQFKTLSDESVAAFARGVEEGRNGKGIIFIFAAGNENRVGDDTNFQGFGANTRFTIPVASVGKNGTHASYSTPGASVFIAAPGGDIRQSETTVVTALNNGGCGVDGGDGTSWAAPLVSGVVALMLEANPYLGWRDVQDILARTAQPVLDDPDNKSLQVNSAGLAHSNWYGFGIVNADAAVNRSLTHVNFGPEEMLLERGFGDWRIYDGPGQNATTVDVTIESNSSEPFVTESVYLSLLLNHTSRGHLMIKLTAPNGKFSILSPGSRPEDQTNGLMKFTTVRHWGEDPNGNWTISLYDRLQGDVSECSGKSAWHWQLEDDFSPSPFNGALSCEFNSVPGLLEDRFCFDGQVDRSNNTAYSKLCTAGVEKACELLDAFENDVDSNTGLKVTEACCACGGGNPPELYPDYLFGWELEVFGHYNATNGTITTTNTTNTTQSEPSIEDSSVNEEDTDVTEPPAVVVDADDSSSSSGIISIPNKLSRVLTVAVAAALIIFASHY